jgi:hypothetical protein
MPCGRRKRTWTTTSVQNMMVFNSLRAQVGLAPGELQGTEADLAAYATCVECAVHRRRQVLRGHRRAASRHGMAVQAARRQCASFATEHAGLRATVKAPFQRRLRPHIAFVVASGFDSRVFSASPFVVAAMLRAASPPGQKPARKTIASSTIAKVAWRILSCQHIATHNVGPNQALFSIFGVCLGSPRLQRRRNGGTRPCSVPCRAFDPTARFETHRSRSFHTSSNLNVR